MFEYHVLPIWLIIALIVLFFVLWVSFTIIDNDKSVKYALGYSYISIIVISVVAIIACFIISSKTDSPLTINDQKIVMAKNINSDKIIQKVSNESGIKAINIKGNNKENVEKFVNGSMVEFAGIKDNSTVQGAIFFEGNNMNIVINEEKANKKETIVVPVK